jgi:hypothetical protein
MLDDVAHRGPTMAGVGLDKVILHIAKKQSEKLMAAAMKRHDRFKRLADKATTEERRQSNLRTARQALEMGILGVNALETSAKKAAEAYKKRPSAKKK